jgi:hypothetical protein
LAKCSTEAKDQSNQLKQNIHEKECRQADKKGSEILLIKSAKIGQKNDLAKN